MSIPDDDPMDMEEEEEERASKNVDLGHLSRQELIRRRREKDVRDKWDMQLRPAIIIKKMSDSFFYFVLTNLAL